jgi:hypothetical protein
VKKKFADKNVEKNIVCLTHTQYDAIFTHIIDDVCILLLKKLECEKYSFTRPSAYTRIWTIRCAINGVKNVLSSYEQFFSIPFSTTLENFNFLTFWTCSGIKNNWAAWIVFIYLRSLLLIPSASHSNIFFVALSSPFTRSGVNASQINIIQSNDNDYGDK